MVHDDMLYDLSKVKVSEVRKLLKLRISKSDSFSVFDR